MEQSEEIITAALNVTLEEVAEEEERTRHQMRALVNVIRAHVSPKTKPFVHLGATSNDIVDTANAFRYKNFVEEILIPTLGGDQTRLETAAYGLPGKISGAVGTYAAFGLLLPHPRALEVTVLGILGLAPGVSTQIVHPEGWTDLMHECICILGRLARLSTFAKDMWLVSVPKIMTTYSDQISEHQRDLTNSASQRFMGEILAATYYAAREVNYRMMGV
ncbi:MAG TPA: hypothetical protein VFK94_06580 [Patescibacteria group bacterium]|nr:hypothetical protein [Patescibacteria group bacterium]